MKVNTEYTYQGIDIKITYYPSTDYADAGWHWQASKDGAKMADSFKQYPYPEEEVLEKAKQELDWLLDIDSDDFPKPLEDVKG